MNFAAKLLRNLVIGWFAFGSFAACIAVAEYDAALGVFLIVTWFVVVFTCATRRL